MIQAVRLLLATCLALATPLVSSAPADFGGFSADPVLSWDPDGRTMVIVDDFTYTDPNSNRWAATKGSKVDGASIPQIFWSLIGGPFEGQYRNASIVHDTECTKPYKHRWQDVHRMFYNASRAGGVGWLKAKVMFAAVYHFGPRWEFNGEPVPERSLRSADDFFRVRSLIRRESEISLQAIEGLTHDALVGKVSDLELAAERRCGGELQSGQLRYLDEELNRGNFVPGGSTRGMGDWENYLGCMR